MQITVRNGVETYRVAEIRIEAIGELGNACSDLVKVDRLFPAIAFDDILHKGLKEGR